MIVPAPGHRYSVGERSGTVAYLSADARSVPIYVSKTVYVQPVSEDVRTIGNSHSPTYVGISFSGDSRHHRSYFNDSMPLIRTSLTYTEHSLAGKSNTAFPLSVYDFPRFAPTVRDILYTFGFPP